MIHYFHNVFGALAWFSYSTLTTARRYVPDSFTSRAAFLSFVSHFHLFFTPKGK